MRTEARYLDSSAEISPCGLYRYWLARRIGMGEQSVAFIGLNPSTADATQDDPTIRRCVGFAKRWGYDWLLVGNLYGFRSTNPRGLPKDDCESVGPGNQDALRWIVHKSHMVVAAWGAHRLTPYAQELVDWLITKDIFCLGMNRDGSPKHPLYLPKTTGARPYQWSESDD